MKEAEFLEIYKKLPETQKWILYIILFNGGGNGQGTIFNKLDIFRTHSPKSANVTLKQFADQIKLLLNADLIKKTNPYQFYTLTDDSYFHVLRQASRETTWHEEFEQIITSSG
ncbi:MAG: hypothetical protein R3D00_05980 [Bacteroidia bacterium]